MIKQFISRIEIIQTRNWDEDVLLSSYKNVLEDILSEIEKIKTKKDIFQKKELRQLEELASVVQDEVDYFEKVVNSEYFQTQILPHLKAVREARMSKNWKTWCEFADGINNLNEIKNPSQPGNE